MHESLEEKITNILAEQLQKLPPIEFEAGIETLNLTRPNSFIPKIKLGIAASFLFIAFSTFFLLSQQQLTPSTELVNVIALSQKYETQLQQLEKTTHSIVYFETLAEIETIDKRLSNLYAQQANLDLIVETWKNRVNKLAFAIQLSNKNTQTISI